MVIDSSAVLAIVSGPDQGAFLGAMANADEPMMSAATLFESRLVALRKSGPEQDAKLRYLLPRLNVRIVPFDESQAELPAVA